MARIAGTNIPDNKRIEASLPYIFGIGLTKSREILKQTKIDPEKRTKDLNQDEINILRNYIEKNFKVEGDLKREILLNIKRLKDIKSYRGSRHAKGLPTRGQRTKTNSRTVRGNKRVSAGSGRKVSAQKT